MPKGKGYIEVVVAGIVFNCEYYPSYDDTPPFRVIKPFFSTSRKWAVNVRLDMAFKDGYLRLNYHR